MSRYNKGGESKKHYEANMEKMLGGMLDEDGNPIWAGYRTHLRDLATGKKPKYELFPTTSGFAMGSKPNGKGEWQQVKGGSIDPAVMQIFTIHNTWEWSR